MGTGDLGQARALLFAQADAERVMGVGNDVEINRQRPRPGGDDVINLDTRLQIRVRTVTRPADGRPRPTNAGVTISSNMTCPADQAKTVRISSACCAPRGQKDLIDGTVHAALGHPSTMWRLRGKKGGPYCSAAVG